MKNQKRWALLFFLSPVLLWLVVMIVLPHIDLLIMSFRIEADDGRMAWSFNNYLSFFEEPIYWLTFVRTALYSILVTLLTLVIALPLAFYITKVVVPKFQGFLLVLLLLPFWVSELVRVYGWMILLRESGVINHFLINLGVLQQPVEMLYKDATMILGLVYTSMLFMVVPIVSVLESLDDNRNHHKKHGGVNQPQNHGGVFVKHLDGLLQDSQIDQKMIDDPAFPQQDHPAVDPDQFADPEGQQQQDQQKSLEFWDHHLRNIKSEGQGYHQGKQGDQDGIKGGPHKGKPVYGFFKKAQVIVKAPCHPAVIGLDAKRHDQQIDMGQNNHHHQPQQNRRQEK